MQILEILKVILLGIVEGITEWLPISSTGHMILVDEFVHLNVREEFLEVFLVVIQLGAILAVVILFWNRIWPFCSHKLTGQERRQLEDLSAPRKQILTFILRFCDLDKWLLWLKILTACIPTVLIAIPFDDLIEDKLFNYVTVAITLIFYGIILILIENRKKKNQARIRKVSQITFWTALIIGCFQVLALIPGTSRSGATIIGGILAGCSRPVAAEFTFYLAIPTMLGASLLKLIKYGFAFTSWEVTLLVLGMVVAFLVSLFAIKFLMGYIKKHDFKVFGWYRIILGVVVLLYFLGLRRLFA